MHRTRHHDESGQGYVELALCLPLFLLFIAGTAEIANIAWASVQINNAAHAGAQFGSQSHANAANTSGIQTAAQREVPSFTLATTPAQTCSCVSPSGGSAGTGCQTLTQCPSPNIITDNIQVSVQAVVRPIVHYPGLPATYTMNAQATMGVLDK